MLLLADQDDAAAQTFLGLIYTHGDGVPQNYAEAARWFRRAASQGEATAQFSLALKYHLGQGVPQDHSEAVKWYRMPFLDERGRRLFAANETWSLGRGGVTAASVATGVQRACYAGIEARSRYN